MMNFETESNCIGYDFKNISHKFVSQRGTSDSVANISVLSNLVDVQNVSCLGL